MVCELFEFEAEGVDISCAYVAGAGFDWMDGVSKRWNIAGFKRAPSVA